MFVYQKFTAEISVFKTNRNAHWVFDRLLYFFFFCTFFVDVKKGRCSIQMFFSLSGMLRDYAGKGDGAFCLFLKVFLNTYRAAFNYLLISMGITISWWWHHVFMIINKFPKIKIKYLCLFFVFINKWMKITFHRFSKDARSRVIPVLCTRRMVSVWKTPFRPRCALRGTSSGLPHIVTGTFIY